jgi:hypothetical protein
MSDCLIFDWVKLNEVRYPSQSVIIKMSKTVRFNLDPEVGNDAPIFARIPEPAK